MQVVLRQTKGQRLPFASVQFKRLLSGLPSREETSYERVYGSRNLTEKEIQTAKDSTFAGISKLSDIVVSSAKGLWVNDIHGNKYLDFTSGIGALSTGHGHPKVIEAVTKQVQQVVHAQIGISTHESLVKLMNKFKAIFPPQLNSYFFWNSGSEAIEAAIKLARQATKKTNIISFQGGYHGRTYAALTISTSKNIFTTGVAPLPSGFYQAPFPYWNQMPKGLSQSEMVDYCIEELQRILLQKSSPSDTAAIIIEPILGEGGYVVPPADFLSRLQEICHTNHILMIVDEVQTGFGRTGTMFAYERSNIIPDIVTVAKGMGSGFPISGVVTKKHLSDKQPVGSMGGTYAGNAISCAAAVATLEVFEEENLLQNVNVRGEQLRKGLEEITKRKAFPVKEIRGMGLMQAIEFDHKVVPKGFAMQFAKEMLNEKMLLLTCGAFETIRFIPSLTISKEEVDLGLEKVEKVFNRIL